MIVQEASYANTRAALQRAVVAAAGVRKRFVWDSGFNGISLGETTVIRTRKRIDDAIDRARNALDTPDTLCLLLSIADIVAVAGLQGDVTL